MRAARRDLPALTRLWQACFGDTEAEVRAFWQALFDCTPVYLRRAPDGSPAAMLCALPAELVGDDGDAVPAAYLYAVCTAPALRGRGNCRLLLQEAEQDLKRQGICAAVLVPAEESLFGFYARFGYRTVFTCRTETVPAARGDCSITPLTPDGWQSLRELQLYDSHLSYPPELLRWQETISCSSGAGLYRIETGDAVCCAAAERDGETLLVRELLPDCPEAAAALADKLGCLLQQRGWPLPHRDGRCRLLRRGGAGRRNAARARAAAGLPGGRRRAGGQARMPGGVLPHGWRHAALRHGKIARRNAAPAAGLPRPGV